MNRRGFLQSILALAAAPAIVKAESLMKVVSPKILGAEIFTFGEGDWTVEGHFKLNANRWHHIAQVVKDGVLYEYVDNMIVPTGTITTRYPILRNRGLDKIVQLQPIIEDTTSFYVDSIRVSSVARFTDNFIKPIG